MPTIRVQAYFVIYDPSFPLGFAFVFPYLDDWIILAPVSDTLVQVT
jgi:hypothetical protein